MAILAFGVFLFFAGKLVVPVLAAIAVGMTFGPVIRFTKSRGVPDWVMALVVLLLLIGALNAAVIMLAGPVTELMGRAPELGTAIKEKLHVLDRPLAALYELQAALGFGPTGRGVDVSNSRVIEGVVTVVTPAAIQLLMQLVLFFGTLFFFIIGRTEFRKYALNWCASRSRGCAR